jgi:hypothetical protein
LILVQSSQVNLKRSSIGDLAFTSTLKQNS